MPCEIQTDGLKTHGSIAGQKEYNAIDLVKFMCAIFVVSGHIAPFGSTDNLLLRLFNFGIQNWLVRIAVSFFFASSGFFLYRKSSIEDFSLKPSIKYVIKLIKIYAIWTLIYCPLRVEEILTSEEGVIHGILFYGRDIIFTGSYIQLWFFPALIFSVVVLSFLLAKKIPLKKIVVVASCLYAIGLLAQSWFGVIEPLRDKTPQLWSLLKLVQKVIVTTRDGLFDGLLFVSIGACVAFNGFRIPQKKAFIGFVISYCFMFVEAFAVKYFDFVREYDMYIFAVPTTYFAFGLAVNYRIPSRGNVYKTLRVLSSLVFYIHLWVAQIVRCIFSITGFEFGIEHLMFVFTLIVSIASSYLIYKLSERSHFTWLKQLYS